MKIASLQLSTLPMSKSKLDYYFRICEKKDVKLVLLGEYVLNSFFKELETMPLSMAKEQSNHKIKILKELAKEYNLCIVAPIVLVKKGKKYKSIAKFTPKSTSFYDQQFLINYKHWNEEKFFDNDTEKKIEPFTFLLDGLRFAPMGGFEVHFDPLWTELLAKKVDVVLLPSASTFDSKIRWKEIAKTRAFLNGMYILRANRIGDYKDKKSSWKFYGESFATNPYGEIDSMLGDKEEMLIIDIDKNDPKEAKKAWGFRNQILKKI